MLDNLWYNSDLVKPEEVRTYNDLLNPKWSGKIGIYDPRLSGAGLGMWAFLWMNKGEDFLKKLVEQKLMVAEQRPLVDQLAKGRLAITIGVTYHSFVSFIKSGLPLRPFPSFKEGTYVSVGNGGPVVVKNSSHPMRPESL